MLPPEPVTMQTFPASRPDNQCSPWAAAATFSASATPTGGAVRSLRAATDGVGHVQHVVTGLQRLYRCERQADLGVESGNNQPPGIRRRALGLCADPRVGAWPRVIEQGAQMAHWMEIKRLSPASAEASATHTV